MSSIIKNTYSQLIKSEALKAGFDACGISKACFLEDEAPRIENWLKNHQHAGMTYMENNLDKRLDPTLLVDGIKTVISLTYNYYSEHKQTEGSYYKVAQYALLEDYHFFLKQKMALLIEKLKKSLGDFNASCFVDSAPILEKAWAEKIGMGWIGKNSLLISQKKGSYFFICEIRTVLEKTYDSPLNKDFCETCIKCIEACPTKAINDNRTIDTNKCISRLTIEDKTEINPALSSAFDGQISGCDICQEVCPWNRLKKNNTENESYINHNLLALKKEDWENLDNINFERIFKNSPLYRRGFKKIKNNIDILKK